jgi:hypothetical protein
MAVGQAKAQSDSIAQPKEPLRLFSFADPHSPKKASIYSAVIPGLGQIYNRKYWKAPIIYASMGAAAWFTFDQRRIMRDSNASFRALYALGKSPSVYAIEKRDDARKFRDFGILALSALYVLQIVDATVDAHFYKLNIDADLQASVRPNPSHLFSLTYRF